MELLNIFPPSFILLPFMQLTYHLLEHALSSSKREWNVQCLIFSFFSRIAYRPNHHKDNLHFSRHKYCRERQGSKTNKPIINNRLMILNTFQISLLIQQSVQLARIIDLNLSNPALTLGTLIDYLGLIAQDGIAIHNLS